MLCVSCDKWQEASCSNGYYCALSLQFLVARGAGLDHRDGDRQTLLHYAVQNIIDDDSLGWPLQVVGGPKEILHVLLGNNNAVDTADWIGYTALHRAAGVGNKKAVERF